MDSHSTRTDHKPRDRQQRRAYRTTVVLFLPWAVTAAALLAVEPAAQKKLVVEVLQGQGIEHDITSPRESSITIRVADEMQQPVAGAVVVLQLPQWGPGGNFSNGTRFHTILTSANGQATAQGFRPNSAPGEFPIVATVSYRDYRSVTLNIEQKNVAPAGQVDEPSPVRITKRESRKLITLVAIVGGVAAGAALGLSGGGGSGGAISPQAPPNTGPSTSINPGNPNFSPPR
jgi:hypothetical protein